MAFNHSIIIVGSGFSGICMGIRLKKAGIDDFVILERAGEIGGTWRDDHYPGAACDVQSHLYSFSFEPNPEWTRMFAPQAEIQDYLQKCARKYGLLPHLRLNAQVTRASYDAEEGLWLVSTADERAFRGRSLVLGTGGLSRPALPDIPGLSSFRGESFHTAAWNHDYELEGKRVAVIGTGASAIQVVPAIAPKVGKLKLFQRTPPWIIPKPDRLIAQAERLLFRRVGVSQRAARALIYLRNESFALGFVVAPAILRKAAAVPRRHLARQVASPELRKKLTPDYTLGCKRVLLSNEYYPALQRENVEVVTEGIRRITADAIVTRDGRKHEVDALILATGFQAAEAVSPFEIRGRDGLKLSDAWKDGAEAYLGTSVHGFPNLFFLTGPNTGLGHSSMVLMIEAQAGYVLGALQTMRAKSVRALEVKASSQKQYNRWITRRMARTVWSTGGCVSWYQTSTGRNTTLFPGFTFEFRAKVSRFESRAYRLEAFTNTAASAQDFEFHTASAALKLPSRLLARREVDGAELHSEMRMLLGLRALRGRHCLGAGDVESARSHILREALVGGGRPIPVGRVRDFTLPGAAGPIQARHYEPVETWKGQPLLVFFHGGGFAAGSVESHDAPCRALCRDIGAHIVSVEYRLAPEHPFPAGLDDAYAAFRWVQSHAAAFGTEASRVGVAGDSAGGNFAAVVAQLARDRGAPPPALHLLIYPRLDMTSVRRSMELFASGYLLTRSDLERCDQLYWESCGADPADHRISPLLAPSHSGVGPAVIVTAGFDPLRDEGTEYESALRRAGNPTWKCDQPALLHGFINMIGISPASRQAMRALASVTREALELPSMATA